jgi:hypothetical protein
MIVRPFQIPVSIIFKREFTARLAKTIDAQNVAMHQFS